MIINNLEQLKGIIRKEGNKYLFRYKGFIGLISRATNQLNIDKLTNDTRFHLCGYVGLPKWHKYYKKGYGKVDINCHGGLTFGGFMNDKSLWFIGFDCAHAQDQTNLPDIHDSPAKVLPAMFGSYEYRDLEYVKNQIKSIIDQIISIEDITKMREELDEIEQGLIEKEI